MILFKYIFIIFASSLPFLTIAQNRYLTTSDSDTEALKIMKNAKSELQKASSVLFDYTFTSVIPGSEPTVINGKGVQKGDRYYLEMGNKTLYCDGKKLIVYDNTLNEAQINDITDEEGQLTPGSLLKTFSPDEYIYVLAPDKKQKGKSYYSIVLKPADRYSEYSKIEFTINKKSLLPYEVKMIMKDGIKNILKINSIKMNQDVNNNVFIFNKAEHPGVSVEDLRMN